MTIEVKSAKGSCGHLHAALANSGVAKLIFREV